MTEGFLTVSSVRLACGKTISTQRAVDMGLIKPVGVKPAGWGFSKEEVPLGYNMMVDNGRQHLAYLFGGRSPANSYTCSSFGIGTGAKATNAAFTGLESPIPFYDDGSQDLKTVKPIIGVDYPAPYIARVEFAIDTTEAVGMLITEFGLFATDVSSGTATLLCRKTETGLEKSAAFAPTLIWRLRF